MRDRLHCGARLLYLSVCLILITSVCIAAFPGTGWQKGPVQQVTQVADAVTSPPATYNVSFIESGLPAGTLWSVSLNGATNNSSTSTITFIESDGTYAYSVQAVSGFVAQQPDGNLTVNGSNLSLSVVSSPAVPSAYYVQFFEQNLPFNELWNVTLNGSRQSSTTTSVTFSEPNGTYNFSVDASGGYTAYPSTGSVAVNGSYAGVTITFYTNTTTVCDVNFTSVNLRSGASFSLLVTNASNRSGYYFININSGSTMLVYLPAGSYEYSAGEVVYLFPPGGSSNPVVESVTYVHYLNVTASTNVSTYFPLLYNISFEETNLPLGTQWSLLGSNDNAFGFVFESQPVLPGPNPYVVFNTTLANAGSAQQPPNAFLPNGSYFYRGLVNSSVASATASGTFNVTGSPEFVTVDFTSTVKSYTVTFEESGLQPGTSWNVTLDGVTEASNSTNLTFNAISGTYQFSIGTVSGYYSLPFAGNITVNGTAVSQPVKFKKLPSGIQRNSAEYYGAMGAAVAIVIASMAVVELRRRRLP